MSHMSRPDDSVFQAAEAWFVHLESGEATSADRQRFAAWLDEAVAHQQAYAEVSSLCEGIATLNHLADESFNDEESADNVLQFPAAKAAVSPAKSFNGRRRYWLAAAAVLVIGIFSAWGILRFDVERQTRYSTPHGQLRTVALADGSVVTLGANSTMDVRYADDERHVVLKGGEAYFAVRPDAGRPFFVAANDVVVRVIGTQFSVNSGASRITVAVAEGAVEVLNDRSRSLPFLPPNSQERLRVVAGQKLIVARGDGDVREVKLITPEEAGRWRSGHLIYDDAPLRDVIADANRYYGHGVITTSDDVGDLRVTAAFHSRDIDQMLDGLTDLLPIRIDRETEGRVRLSSRNGQTPP